MNRARRPVVVRWRSFSDERCVEDDVRSLGGAGDRLAPARFTHLSIAVREPDSGMGRMESWEGQGTHERTLSQSGTKMEREIVS